MKLIQIFLFLNLEQNTLFEVFNKFGQSKWEIVISQTFWNLAFLVGLYFNMAFKIRSICFINFFCTYWLKD